MSGIFSCGDPLNIYYSVEVSQPQKGETAIYRNLKSKDNLVKTSKDANGKEFESLQEQFLNSVNVYGKNNALGTQQLSDNKTLVVYTTYEELKEQATNFGSGLLNLGLIYHAKKEFQDWSLSFIGIMTKNRHEWMVTEVANMLYNQTMVPMYENADTKMVQHVLNQTNLLTLIGTNLSLSTVLKLSVRNNLKYFIMVEPVTPENQELANKSGLKLLTYQEVVDAGSKNRQQYKPCKRTDIFTFSYTSGTTGTGKACMISHENMLSGIAVVYDYIQVVPQDVYMSYLPLAHMMERLVLNSVLRLYKIMILFKLFIVINLCII